jgi:hypothetical protein
MKLRAWDHPEKAPVDSIPFPPESIRHESALPPPNRDPSLRSTSSATGPRRSRVPAPDPGPFLDLRRAIELHLLRRRRPESQPSRLARLRLGHDLAGLRERFQVGKNARPTVSFTAPPSIGSISIVQREKPSDLRSGLNALRHWMARRRGCVGLRRLCPPPTLSHPDPRREIA